MLDIGVSASDGGRAIITLIQLFYALIQMLVSGFVTYELFSEWKVVQAIYLSVPHRAAEALGLDSYEGRLKGIWMLFVVPLELWLVFGELVVVLRGARILGVATFGIALGGCDCGGPHGEGTGK